MRELEQKLNKPDVVRSLPDTDSNYTDLDT